MRVVPREYPVPEYQKMMFRDFCRYWAEKTLFKAKAPEDQRQHGKSESEENSMEFMTGKKEKEVLGLAQILTEVSEGQEIKVNGAVHSVRDMGEIAFIILRKREGLLQTVFEKGKTEADFSQLREETFVEVTGTLEKEERAPHGVDLRLTAVKILSKPEEPMPIAVSKWKMGASLEARLDMRPLTLRNVRDRARFKIQEGIARAFREYLQKEGFTEIHSPKIGAKGAEGGGNLFKLD